MSGMRSADEIALDFVVSREEMAERYLYEDDEIRGLVRESPDEALEFTDGTNELAAIVGDSSGEYFSRTDELGLAMESHDAGTRIRHGLSDPSRFDEAISGRSAADETDQLSSRLGLLSSGITGGVLHALLLFLALIPVAGAAGVDVVGTRLGGGVLLGCVAVAMFGSELWHRAISYERPYYEGRDNEHYEAGVDVAKWYLGLLAVGGLLYLFISTRGGSVTLARVLSGGLLVVLARLAFGLVVLAAVALYGFLLFAEPGFGAWPAAYRESGDVDAPVASPVQFFFVAPLFLTAWGLLGGAFYQIGGLGAFSVGALGTAAYPLTGAVVAGLLRRL